MWIDYVDVLQGIWPFRFMGKEDRINLGVGKEEL
jgi:hypothetical protein